MQYGVRGIRNGLWALVFSAACAPSRQGASLGPSPDHPLATRLVLALDGVDYRDLQAARAKGLFGQFRAPSRLISTFPSMSDAAWSEIFGLQAPLGYQRVYYNTRLKTVVGDPLDVIRPIEYENRMDLAFNTKWHHLGVYLISEQMARREIDADVREFLRRGGRRTLYAYNVGPDALQHTRGDLERYFLHLDRRLTELQESYRAQTGRDLEIVMLSDHGHNRAVTAGFLPITDALAAVGFKTVRTLITPSDVAFSVDGVATGFGVFCATDSIDRVATVLAALDGVAVVTALNAGDRIVVRADSGLAEITWRGSGATTMYRYRTVRGNPLRYADVVARMERDQALSADGYASAATWLRYTADALYPAAVPRIVSGHTSITRNPAPILVSLDDRVRVGFGTAAVVNKMRPLGGSHGALSATNSLGVIMTNFVDTHDDLTATVRQQVGGFDDLYDPRPPETTLKLSTPGLLRADRWSGYAHPATPPSLAGLADTAAVLVLSVSDRDRRLFDGDPRLRVEIKRTGPGSGRVELGPDATAPVSAWAASNDGRSFVMPMARLSASMSFPSAVYEARIVVEHMAAPASKSRGAKSKRVASTELRTDARGVLAPF